MTMIDYNKFHNILITTISGVKFVAFNHVCIVLICLWRNLVRLVL